MAVIDELIIIENGESKIIDSANNTTIDVINGSYLNNIDYHFAKNTHVSGKNLFDNTAKPFATGNVIVEPYNKGIKVTSKAAASTSSLNAYYSLGDYASNIGKTYNITLSNTNNKDKSIYVGFIKLKGDFEKLTTISSTTIQNGETKTLKGIIPDDTEPDQLIIRLYFYNDNVGAEFILDNVMLEESETATEYEQYSGTQEVRICSNAVEEPIIDLKVSGNSEQQTYTGKNLFDYSTLLNEGKIEIINEKTGEFVWTNPSGIPATYIKAKENTQYFISFKAKAAIEQNVIIPVYYTDGTYRSIEGLSSPDGFVTISGLSQPDKTVDYVKFGGSGGLSVGSIFKELQIEENNTATEYEPYVGGMASPNPEYPQEIESVGDKTLNIFSSYGVSTSGLNTPSANRTLSNVYGTTINSIDFIGEIVATQTQYPNTTYLNDYTNGYFNIGLNGLETGEKYTLIYDFEVLENPLSATDQAILINGASSIFGTVLGNRVKYTFEWQKPTGYETREFVDVRLAGRSMKFKNFMIIEGEVEGFPEYEPYGYKVPVNVSGKNLINKENSDANYYINSSGVKTANDGYGLSVTDKIYVKPSTTYTYSGMGNVRATTVGRTGYQYDKDGNPLEATPQSYGEDITFTTNANCDYILLMYVSTEEKPMLEEGAVKTQYQPYIGPTTTNIYLNEPLRKIGDYADYIDYKNKKVVRNIGESILTGKEIVGLGTTVTSGKYRMYVIGNYGIKPAGDEIVVYSSHYKAETPAQNWLEVESISGYDINDRFCIYDEEHQTVESFVAFATEQYNNGTPIVCDYILETPTEETINIPEISTSKGTTNFVVETSLLPSELKINYWKQI